ncbi:N utilization substance B-like protein, partial [Nymphaea thermarum]
LILYASCLERSDPVRLFEKRVNAKRHPLYVFNRASLHDYHHMSVSGEPVVAETNLSNQPGGRILELCILHIAMAEIAVLGTRYQIVINESVDLAKRFCDDSAPRFINGCLRTFVKEHMGKQPTSQVQTPDLLMTLLD